jgi:phosphatidylinositol glycan class Z
MWRRVYFLLILARVYFALSPSYLHPDENFQGPEVIAGAQAFLSARIATECSTD